MNLKNKTKSELLFSKIAEILTISKKQTLQSINTTMVRTYFQIGKIIVEEQQAGEEKAQYNKKIIENLAVKLTKNFGKGFKARNLELMRKFYILYGKSHTVCAESEIFKFTLSWSHYVRLMRLDQDERKFYEIECNQSNWSIREFERQVSTGLFQRLVLNKDKSKIKEFARKGQIITKPEDAIKDPYILEFLGLDEKTKYSESDLETRIISKMSEFLLELGNGFAFVARQKRITIEEDHFFIDLVFYNYLLRSFVIIDLKIGKLRHQDLGQLQMYVNYYDRFVRSDSDNKTIGIILSGDKNDQVVKITLPEENDQIFASKYKMYLPTKKELQLHLERILN